MASSAGKIAVIDYGMGNLRSVWQALVHVADGRKIVVTADPEVVAGAGRVVFHGQGAMPDCMRELDARGLRSVVIEAARTKPFLGICIGLQMLFEQSEEGNVPGLGVFAGPVRRFPAEKMIGPSGEKLKVPHMGWNRVERHRRRCAFLLRTQLLCRSGRSCLHRRHDRLRHPLYQCGGAG